MLPFGGQFETSTTNGRLIMTTTTVTRLLVGIRGLSFLVQIHVVATLANVLALAQIIDIGQTFTGLALGLHDDLLDLGILRRHQHLGAIEANASQHLNGLGKEANMKDGLGQIDVTKVTGTFGHVTSTRLTTGGAVNDTLPRIHQTAQFGPPSLHGLGELHPTIGHRHPTLQ